MCKTSSREISSCSIIHFLLAYFNMLSSMVQFFNFAKWRHWIQSNPISGQCFSICQWNLNSITAHNFAKLSLLTAYNLVHSFDIICLSETYLNSETPPNDTRLELTDYNFFRSDHPSNNKRGGVCVCYKSTLPLRI